MVLSHRTAFAVSAGIQRINVIKTTFGNSPQLWLVLAAASCIGGGALLIASPAAKQPAEADAKPAAKTSDSNKKSKVGRVTKSEAEWKKILTPMQFEVLRKEGTERAFSGDYHPTKEVGAFRCAGCGLDLFQSNTMFDSGTGWPSFWKPIAGHVIEKTDADGSRTEVLCARCDGHLGHVFDDGPKPTGLRYCMNSVAMKFAKK